MGYYLKDSDRELIAPIFHKMEQINQDFSVPSTNPKKLVYLLRQGLALMDRYKHLRSKFRISQKETKIVFTMKTVAFDLHTDTVPMVAPTFMEIMTELFKDKSLHIKEYTPTSEEYNSLKSYCDENGFTITSPDPSTFNITKNA